MEIYKLFFTIVITISLTNVLECLPVISGLLSGGQSGSNETSSSPSGDLLGGGVIDSLTNTLDGVVKTIPIVGDLGVGSIISGLVKTLLGLLGGVGGLGGLLGGGGVGNLLGGLTGGGGGGDGGGAGLLG
ncbi:uncharacterized protein LOC128952414 [Oppia nitens]|uniref:uncharacterized protein LOC128952414 n=1 Tax=Oppia nitens TaxID=1686743 RepID=UPI0023DAB2C4|nr:uncharacterized protein LOC128952414 [Oppia nitens]